MKPPPIHRSLPERLAMTSVFVGNGIAFGAWAGNIPRLREAAGLSDAALGIALLCISVGAVLAMPLAGRYAARIGTARGCWLAALLLGAALPLPALAPGWTALLGSALLLGAGLGLMDVSMNAHAAGLERRWGAAIMSSFHAGWSLGQLAGAAAAGVLAALGAGLAASLAWPGLAVACCGLAALRLSEGPPEPAAKARLSWPSRPVLVLCALIALSFAIEGGTADWSGVYLRTILGVGPAWASAGLAAFAGTMVVCRIFGDRIVRRLGPVRTVLWGGVLAAVGMVVALLAPGMGLASVGFALVGAGVANIVPVVFTAAGRRGAAGVATVATAGYGAVMASPPLIGFVSQQAGLQMGLILLILGGVVITVLSSRLQDTSQ